MDRTDYDSLPIPTYEEAVALRPTSSQGGAEREGLLGGLSHGASSSSRANGDYRQPTVESARTSLDSDLSMPEVADRAGTEADSLRRDMQEMEIEDEQYHSSSTRSSRLRQHFSKRFNGIATSLTTFRIPSFRTSAFASVLGSLYDRIPHVPDNYRLSLPVAARLFGLGVIGLLLYALLALDVMPRRSYLATHYDLESVRVRAIAEISGDRISEYLRYITSYDHVAGTEGDLFLAKWQREILGAAKLDRTFMQEYYVYLNYPKPDGRSVVVNDDKGKKLWAASLEETGVPTTGDDRQQTLSFHGLSKSATVSGHLVYANHGSEKDYGQLKDLDIKVEGAVVLLRADALGVASQVRRAQDAGAIGCLIYDDPKKDGDWKGKVVPDGRWSSGKVVHRATVALSRWILGDVLTPGMASNVDNKRIEIDGNPALASIPSLPLSWENAKTLLETIRTHGKKVPSSDWVGGVDGVNEWWTGGPETHKVTLKNEQDENKEQTIYNVHGILDGAEDPGSKVIVGNHRDSWCFGSVDPGSGTAVMAEVINVFGALYQLGWAPLRTIEFVSWDAGAYNAIGSTEEVEDKVDALRDEAFAYVNVDVGVYGRRFRASGSPVFQHMMEHALERLGGPSGNTTLLQSWSDDGQRRPLPPPTAAGDHVPFAAIAGVSTLDFGFEGEPDSYPAHSCYETFEWMEQFGDPGFEYHKALAQVWVLLILDLAERPIIPLDLNNFAAALDEYIDTLSKLPVAKGLDVGPLRSAAKSLSEATTLFHQFDDFWSAKVLGSGGYESRRMSKKRVLHNRKLVAFEKNLLDLPSNNKRDLRRLLGRKPRGHQQHGVSVSGVESSMHDY